MVPSLRLWYLTSPSLRRDGILAVADHLRKAYVLRNGYVALQLA